MLTGHVRTLPPQAFTIRTSEIFKGKEGEKNRNMTYRSRRLHSEDSEQTGKFQCSKHEVRSKACACQ